MVETRMHLKPYKIRQDRYISVILWSWHHTWVVLHTWYEHLHGFPGRLLTLFWLQSQFISRWCPIKTLRNKHQSMGNPILFQPIVDRQLQCRSSVLLCGKGQISTHNSQDHHPFTGSYTALSIVNLFCTCSSVSRGRWGQKTRSQAI